MGKSITRETWAITRLKPHPRQEKNFLPASDIELDELKEAILSGKYDPIEVTPDGSIVDGHQRLRAAQELGLEEVRVRVRHDLAGDDVAIELRHLDANANRRQLHHLDRARVVRRRLELQNPRGAAGITPLDQTRLVGDVARLLDLSRKHALRLVRILDTPMVVQSAVIGSKLPVVAAVKVAALDQPTRDRIAAEIAAGDDPVNVVAAHLLKKQKGEPDASRALGRLLRAARAELDRLEGCSGPPQVDFAEIDGDVATLGRIVAYGNKVIPLLRKQKEDFRLANRNPKRSGPTGKRPRNRHRNLNL